VVYDGAHDENYEGGCVSHHPDLDFQTGTIDSSSLVAIEAPFSSSPRLYSSVKDSCWMLR